VVFEDALVGIAAGLAAGAKVIAVATTCPLEALGDAHLAVRSLAEIDWPVFSGLLKPVSQ
jgi:beta-phosphoglucomutase-like phosphatase (HAD superfamily)